MEEITNKDKFTQDIKSLVNLFLAAKNSKADRNFYFGKVVENQDPLKLGRVRVKVFQIFDELSNEDLPYALPDYSQNGEMIIPVIGSLVQVYFENNDYNFPHYTTKVIPKDDVSSEILEDYPNSLIIFSTDNNDFMKINKKKNEFTMRLGSGAFVFCDENGNFDIDCTGCDTGNIRLKTDGKLAMGGPNAELLDILSEAIALLSTTAGTPPVLGSPLNAAVVIQANLLKTKLDTFLKGSL